MKNKNIFNLHKARKVLSGGKHISFREYDYNVPRDLEKYLKEYDVFLAISKFKNQPFEKHLMIATQHQGHNIFVYLEEEMVDMIIKSWKNTK